MCAEAMDANSKCGGHPLPPPSSLAKVIIVVDQLQQWKQEGQGMCNGREELGVSEAVFYKKAIGSLLDVHICIN